MQLHFDKNHHSCPVRLYFSILVSDKDCEFRAIFLILSAQVFNTFNFSINFSRARKNVIFSFS